MSEPVLENLLDSENVEEIKTTCKLLYDLLKDKPQCMNRFKLGLRLVFQSAIGEEFINSLLKDLYVNDRDMWGDTVLHLVVSAGILLVDRHTLRPKMQSIIIKLLAKGADINMRNNRGETPLFFAAKSGQIEAVYVLLQSKADPDIKDVTGDTPLLFVVRFSNKTINAAKIARLLLESGSNVHETDESGWTAVENLVGDNNCINLVLFTELLIWGGSLFVSYGEGNRLLDIIISQDSCLGMKGALVEYVIALQCANLDCSDYAIVESTFPFENFITPRLAKLQIKKIKEIKCGSYSLYNVFDKYADPLYVCDKNVEDAVNKASFKIIYVDYGSLLKAKFVSAKKRYNIMVEAHVKLTDKLPNEIVWKILTFLADEDLESLTNAVNA